MERREEEYSLMKRIGMGTFGVVYQARHNRSGDIVAVKKMKMFNVYDGIQKTTLREIKFLQELDHPNIIKLLNVNFIYLFF